MPDADHDADKSKEAEGLLLAAFEAARANGKTDWRRMRIAVLKNRLLQMTGREFDEESYGASSFREFLSRYSHLIRVDGPDAELVGRRKTDARQRVRPDLWQAMMDFSSGRRYAWDHGLGRARPAQDSDALIVPTISAEDMAAWRQEFAASHADNNRVQNWCAQGMGTKGLPHQLQGVWTGFVRDHVVEKLEEWLKSNGLEEIDPVESAKSAGAIQKAEGGDTLREFVLRCVAAMTPQELASLNLPAGAVARVVGAKE